MMAENIDDVDLYKSTICHETHSHNGVAVVSAPIPVPTAHTTDPMKIMEAATGMLMKTGKEVAAKTTTLQINAIENSTNINATLATSKPVLQVIEKSFWQRNFEYQAPEDDVMHGHISDAQLAFYARNVLLVVALLALLIILWKFCAAHRCWRRRKQNKFSEPMPLDFKQQIKNKRAKSSQAN